MGNAPADLAIGKVRPERLRNLLVEAVKIYSPTYAEAAVCRLFADALGAHPDIDLVLQPVPGPSDDPGRVNVIAFLGPRPPAVMLVGHVDTIPLQHEEKTPVTRLENDILFGLGSCDMKSGCAAMVEAILAVAESGLSLEKGMAVALVVGEEEYGDGATALLTEYGAPLVIVGEPTNLSPCTKHYSYAEMGLTATGRQVHAAMARRSHNAIHGLLAWLDGLLDRIGTYENEGETIMSVREIRGGGNLFVTPDACEAVLDVHSPPDLSKQDLHRVMQEAKEEAERKCDCVFSMETLYESAGFLVDESQPALIPLREAFASQQLPWQSGVFLSHCDAPLFHRAGSITLVCGPGRLERAHTRKEHVYLADVDAMARVYAAVLANTCARRK